MRHAQDNYEFYTKLLVNLFHWHLNSRAQLDYFASQFPFISCFYTRLLQCLKLLYTGKDQSLCKAILFRPHYIQSWRKFKDFSRTCTQIQGLFKEKWNSRTFQGLPLKFKDFSRLCKPCIQTRQIEICHHSPLAWPSKLVGSFAWNQHLLCFDWLILNSTLKGDVERWM